MVAGAGPSFCSGGDLDEFGTAPELVTAHFVRARHGAGGLLHRLAARAEVRVHGSCVGASIELLAFAGRVVAAPGTTFRLREAAMGLMPGAGGTVSIPRRIGPLACVLSRVVRGATGRLDGAGVEADRRPGLKVQIGGLRVGRRYRRAVRRRDGMGIVGSRGGLVPDR